MKHNTEYSGLETHVFHTSELLGSATAAPESSAEESKDLGFGVDVARGTRHRLVNRDGSFNVRRSGYSFIRSRSLYHGFLNASWPQFLVLLFCAYMGVNVLFAVLYFLCGPDALQGAPLVHTSFERLLSCFFFSVQTFATIGYGQITPFGLPANCMVTIESLVGLMGFSLSTGLFFARISRPTARISFSNHALIAPYRGITSFQFRITNERKNQITRLEAKLIMSRLEQDGSGFKRKFYELPLERKQLLFFPLHWTVVHPIDKESPLFEVTREQLAATDAEFLILLSGMDDTFSQTVNCRSSYKCDEVVWGARFRNILQELADGTVSIDLKRIHEYDKVSMP